MISWLADADPGIPPFESGVGLSEPLHIIRQQLKMFKPLGGIAFSRSLA